MANVEIVTAGPGEVALLTTLYNEVFRPPRDAAFFQRRFLGRYNLVILIARLDDRPVGFAAGFELKPSTYYAWLCGVLPDFRSLRQGHRRIERITAEGLEAGHQKIGSHRWNGVTIRLRHMGHAHPMDITCCGKAIVD